MFKMPQEKKVSTVKYTPIYSHWNIMVNLKNDILGRIIISKGRVKVILLVIFEKRRSVEPRALVAFRIFSESFHFLPSFMHRRASSLHGFSVSYFCHLGFGTHRTKRKLRVNKSQHARDKRTERKRVEIDDLRRFCRKKRHRTPCC